MTSPGTKGELRCNITQLVFICDDDGVQQALPTILLISKKAFSDATFHRMQASLPPHIHLWRQPRAWVTGKTMAAACRLLASALEPWRPHAEVIFSADTYRGHLTQGVWRAMARNRFAYMLIPAKLTWGLQPCDTHVFAGYKRQLLEEQQLWRITQAASSPSGGAGMSPPPASAPQSQVMCLLHSLIAAYEKSIRRRSWTAAFASNGLGHRLADISTSVLQQLQFDHVPHDLDRKQHIRTSNTSSQPKQTSLWTPFSPFAHGPLLADMLIHIEVVFQLMYTSHGPSLEALPAQWLESLFPHQNDCHVRPQPQSRKRG